MADLAAEEGVLEAGGWRQELRVQPCVGEELETAPSLVATVETERENRRC